MSLVKAALDTAINTGLNPLLLSAFTNLFQAPLNALPTGTADQQALKTQLMSAAVTTAQQWSDSLSPQIATAVSTAVDAYVRTGVAIVPLGVPVATAGSAVAQVGATTAPGIGVIS